MVYRVAKEKNYKDHFTIYPDEQEDFERVNKDFMLIYFSSFSNEKNSVYTDISNKMKQMNKTYNLDLFRCISRISTKDKKRWTPEFIKKEIFKFGNTLKKVFLCGPTSFTDAMQDALKEVGVEKNIMCLV